MPFADAAGGYRANALEKDSLRVSPHFNRGYHGNVSSLKLEFNSAPPRALVTKG